MQLKTGLFFLITFFSLCTFAAETDPLPSWREGPIKASIIEFVTTVTKQGSRDYVVPADRIATIDNDGTLWVEQPIYTQVIFMMGQSKNKDFQNLDKKMLEKIFIASSTNMSVDTYESSAKQWLATAINPRYKKHYTELVYQPMLEVIRYLEENQFAVYIVSGGGQEFVRAFSDTVYHIPVEHVIGSTGKTRYQYRDGHPELIKTDQPLFISDHAGKPEAINLFIGKKPIIAFGNSDGDKDMLEWTQSSPHKTLMLLVHHDDSVREYAYDTQSKVGTFSTELFSAAKQNHWQIISMKDDWKVIFPFELRADQSK